MYFIEFKDIPSNPWDDVGYVSLDYKMPGRGFFFTGDEYLCVGYGITEAIPFGDHFSCEPSSVGVIGDISCGVTGCFGIADGKVYFREGLSSLCAFLLFLKLIYCLLLLFTIFYYLLYLPALGYSGVIVMISVFI